jgi:flagellar assembly factor FliW
MRIGSSRFGDVEVQESDLIFLERGLLGFPEFMRCAILRIEPDTPFEWLQSCDDPTLALPVADLRMLLPDCHPKIHPQDITGLGADSEDDLIIKVILRISDGDMTNPKVNLKAPVLINPKNRKAKQVIVSDPSLPHHYPLFDS